MFFARNSLVFLLLVSLALSAMASRHRRDESAAAGDNAESKANNILENAEQLGNTLRSAVTKYLGEGRVQLANFYEKAEIRLKDATKKLRETSGDQYNKAMVQVQNVITSMRGTLANYTAKPGEATATAAEATASN